MIHQIDGIPAAQEDVLETFSAVRRGLPGTARLKGSVEHDDRQRFRVLGHLIEDVGVIAVKSLALGGRSVVVVGSGRGRHRAANREAALLLHDKRLHLGGGLGIDRT
ncbi:hypothetical protein D3C80_1452080 [compost metagenome]